MAIVDRRGAVISGTDPATASDPNPGLAIKTAVRVATTGADIVLSGLQTIDGVALAAADRVLVKDQDDATDNGIYNASSGDWTRATDCDDNSEFATGTYVRVNYGDTNARKQYQVTTPDPIIIGTSELTFEAIVYPKSSFDWVVNGGGAALPPGYFDDFRVPFDCVIQFAELAAHNAGNLVLDILRSTEGVFPPVASMTGTDQPSLTGTAYVKDATLTGWTLNLLEGDRLRFIVLSNDVVRGFTLSLPVTR